MSIHRWRHEIERLTAENESYSQIIRDFAAEQGKFLRTELKLLDRIEKLEGAARKTLKEQDEADDHHSAACTNWTFLEHSQHQCGLCDLREALEQEGE